MAVANPAAGWSIGKVAIGAVACAMICILSAALSGCGNETYGSAGNGTSGSVPAHGGNSLPPIQEPDWNNPIQGAANSLAAAQQQVPFHITQFAGGMRPYRILVSPAVEPKPLRVAVLQYRTGSGVVDVFEQKASITAAEFRDFIDWWVAQNGKPDTLGTESSALLSRRYPAMVTVAPGGRRAAIMWLKAGVKYSIQGPSIDKQDAVRLGNLLASS